MAFESDKIMFEIYREEGYSRRYRVVYFTELDEHNKESEINAAMAGEHVYDGFLLGSNAVEGKQAMVALLDRLNAGESFTAADLTAVLLPFLAPSGQSPSRASEGP